MANPKKRPIVILDEDDPPTKKARVDPPSPKKPRGNPTQIRRVDFDEKRPWWLFHCIDSHYNEVQALLDPASVPDAKKRDLIVDALIIDPSLLIPLGEIMIDPENFDRGHDEWTDAELAPLDGDWAISPFDEEIAKHWFDDPSKVTVRVSRFIGLQYDSFC
jgi:hypothetical protein